MLTKLIKKSGSVLKFSRQCRACNSLDVKRVLKLEPTPFEDHFITKSELGLKQTKYPLDLYLCKECNLVFLAHILNPNFSYKYYLYNTEITLGLNEFYKKTARFLVKKLKLKRNNLIIDIGSNDGTFLKHFKDKGINILGIEPAINVAKKARKNNIKTINSFFNNSLVKKLLQRKLKANLITANYVFANIENINNFIDNVEKLLARDGAIAINTGYHPHQFKKNMFDYIYHEHYSYFSLSFLKKFFNKKNLEIVYVEKTKPKLGSLFFIVKRRDPNKKYINKKMSVYLKQEKNSGINNINYFYKLSRRINDIRQKIHYELNKIKRDKIQLIGYGASHNTTILLHHFKLNKYLKFIVDDNPIKQGLYSPGFHLSVHDGKKIYDNKKSKVLILAWQHSEKIIQKNRLFLKKGGEFIVPLPKFKRIKKI